MLGENIMLINSEEMKRAVAIYLDKIFNCESLIVTNVRACKYDNKQFFEIKTAEAPKETLKQEKLDLE